MIQKDCVCLCCKTYHSAVFIQEVEQASWCQPCRTRISEVSICSYCLTFWLSSLPPAWGQGWFWRNAHAVAQGILDTFHTQLGNRVFMKTNVVQSLRATACTNLQINKYHGRLNSFANRALEYLRLAKMQADTLILDYSTLSLWLIHPGRGVLGCCPASRTRLGDPLLSWSQSHTIFLKTATFFFP